MATRFTAKEKAQLQTRFAEHSPKVRAHGDVATVHIFGGHYYIKKRENGYDWRWADATPSMTSARSRSTTSRHSRNCKGG